MDDRRTEGVVRAVDGDTFFIIGMKDASACGVFWRPPTMSGGGVEGVGAGRFSAPRARANALALHVR